MKIRDIELHRRKEIHEYLTTTHMFSFFVMTWALVLNTRLFSMEDYSLTIVRVLLVSSIGVLAFILISRYNEKIACQNLITKFTWVDILYVSFHLVVATVTIFLVDQDTAYIEVILLLPVITTASLMGVKAGMVMASICTAIIYTKNILLGPLVGVFEITGGNIITISVMFIMAWFSGAQTNLENQHRKQLTRLASTDFLTGLYNYRYFQDKFHEYIQKASEKNPFALIIIDIDYFKHYNDIYGHQAGDEVLAAVADILSARIGRRGIVSRYSGDEFVIGMPNTDSEQAIQVAEEIGKSIRSHHYPGVEYQPEGRLTVSCGVAVYPTHARNAKELLKHADQALFRAKSLNKNKVELYFSVFDNLDLPRDEKELLNSIRTLVSVINAKDRYTYGHSERVISYSTALARKIGLSQEEINLLGYAAFLHDIGKIEIDREVLNKVDMLNEKELEELKQHPQWGGDIVAAVTQLQPIIPIIRYHHENYDGTGYPDGLKGSEIPLLARIIRIADTYDAMVSLRPYKNPLSIPDAIKELTAGAGVQFDPELVPPFLEIIQEEIAQKTDG
ncbi:MAG: diguanylate cyclase [Syntrophomonadales bacterium]|jgi:diguanylate cyclase (GGDEF)-like protein